MLKNWLEPVTHTPHPALSETIGGHPLISEILVNRGITQPDQALAFIDPNHYTPSPPCDLPGLSKAADRIQIAIQRGETILVWGDFDVDGQTATTLLVEGLNDLGADVLHHIPVRSTEGHGIQFDVLRNIIVAGSLSQHHKAPDLLLTCDTGISEHQAVDFAQSSGIDVIITDHHEPPEHIPDAYAVVNPHFLPNKHPLCTLPGVGVAYKLIEELYKRHEKPDDADRFLDLVALGIVADVAELKGDTRYLLQRGLVVLRKTNRIGLQELYRLADINPAQLDESHIGYTIGPRLNALGRLSDANSIIELFTTSEPGRVRMLAAELEGLNRHRRQLTKQVYQGTLAQIERNPDLLDYAALVLAHPGWPNGIIGIVASRLVDRFAKPTILLSIQEDQTARGSARSIDGIHITQAITAQADLLKEFGGHSGAAGLSLPAENISKFRTRLSRYLRATTTEVDWIPSLQIDAYFTLDQLCLDLVDEIDRLAPFGAGNPPLTIVSRDLRLINSTKIGRDQEHLRLVVEDLGGNPQEFIWWQGSSENLPAEGITFDLAYRISANTFRGERRLQLEWIDFRPAEMNTITPGIETPIQEVIDYRKETNPRLLLQTLRTQEDALVWAEGELKSKIDGLNRHQLTPGKSLVIWTAPPSYSVLKSAIERVHPDKIYFFALSPQIDTLNTFLSRLSGLVKNVINKKNGQVTIDELAAEMAHDPKTIQMGLDLLQAKGQMQLESNNEGRVLISLGTNDEKPVILEIASQLKHLLDEASAFRKYIQRVSSQSLQI